MIVILLFNDQDHPGSLLRKIPRTGNGLANLTVFDEEPERRGRPGG
jgi:hypothetical protein